MHLPTIVCQCGAEILLVPNVELMSKAIEAHVEEHNRKLKGCKRAKEEAEHIELDLIAQVFSKISYNFIFNFFLSFSFISCDR